MMFTITGFINKGKYTLNYTEGELSGDKEAVHKATEESKINHGSVGFHPDVIESEYLSQEIPAYALITSFVFDSIESEENDWEAVPDNAVF